MSRILKHRNEYSKHGYTIVKKIFSKDMAKDISDEINVAVNVKKYYDQKGTLRRIERVFDKGKTLKNINDNILILLSKIFEKDFTIFKDKCNAKPPGGEGFYAHYDGIFLFKNSCGNQEKGWYKYTDFFVNVLIALDDCNIDNGTIEIADAHKGSYDELLLNTKQDGTPDLIKDIEDSIDFKPIELKSGEIVVFSNTCPHRSKKNTSNIDRKTLYYTYSLLKDGSFYEKYFKDKENSKNTSSKSLSGES